jgi:hypothetical protein
MLTSKDMSTLDTIVRDVSITGWAMDRTTRADVLRKASTAILAARGISMASEDADDLIKDLRDTLGLKTPADARLTHGALGK